MLEKYFEKYDDSLISFNFVKKIKTIHFWINEKWMVPENLLPDTMNIQHNRSDVDKDNIHRYYGILYVVEPEITEDVSQIKAKEITWDDLYSVIEAVFEYNLDKERKDVLLKEKITELQESFSKLTLTELTSMKFS